MLTPVSESLALELRQQEEGGESVLPESNSAVTTQSSTIMNSNGQLRTKRRHNKKKSSQIPSNIVPTITVPTSAATSSRKVAIIPSPSTIDEPLVTSTRSGRATTKPVRFLVTIVNGQDPSFQQVGEEDNVTPN
jgi:hypothetical protein